MSIHVSRNGELLGSAFSLDEVNRGLATGTLEASDLAWKEGMPCWQPLASLEGVVTPSVSKEPPPLQIPDAARTERAKAESEADRKAHIIIYIVVYAAALLVIPSFTSALLEPAHNHLPRPLRRYLLSWLPLVPLAALIWVGVNPLWFLRVFGPWATRQRLVFTFFALVLFSFTAFVTLTSDSDRALGSLQADPSLRPDEISLTQNVSVSAADGKMVDAQQGSTMPVTDIVGEYVVTESKGRRFLIPLASTDAVHRIIQKQSEKRESAARESANATRREDAKRITALQANLALLERKDAEEQAAERTAMQRKQLEMLMWIQQNSYRLNAFELVDAHKAAMNMGTAHVESDEVVRARNGVREALQAFEKNHRMTITQAQEIEQEAERQHEASKLVKAEVSTTETTRERQAISDPVSSSLDLDATRDKASPPRTTEGGQPPTPSGSDNQAVKNPQVAAERHRFNNMPTTVQDSAAEQLSNPGIRAAPPTEHSPERLADAQDEQEAEQLQALYDEWLEASNAEDASAEAKCFADPVDYLDEGAISRDKLARMLRTDRSVWPIHRYAVRGDPKVGKLSDSEFDVSFDLQFDDRNPRTGKTASGVVSITWRVRRNFGRFEIASVKQRLLERTTPPETKASQRLTPSGERIYEGRAVRPKQ